MREWARDYLEAVRELRSLWGLIALALLFLGFAGESLRDWIMEDFPMIWGVPLPAWGVMGFLFLLFLGMMHAWVRLYRRIKPRLGMDEQIYVSETTARNSSDAPERRIYFSVRPFAKSETTLINCQGFITSVQIRGRDGKWQDTAFVERQTLMWGADGVSDKIWANIDNQTVQPLNIFYVKETDARIHPCIPSMLFRHKEIFHKRDGQIFRFAINIRPQNGPGERCYAVVRIGKDTDRWDDIEVTYEPWQTS